MKAGRVSPVSAVGSLLKAMGENKRPGRRPKRERDGGHLALVRKCPCLCCDNDPAGEAAHVRMTIAGKPISAMGLKPDDRFAVSLCHQCHMKAHRIGEMRFWMALGLNPLKIANNLAAMTGDLPAMRGVVFEARERRK